MQPGLGPQLELMGCCDSVRNRTNYTRIQPGQDFIPRGSIERKDFDSHICFASAHPVRLPNETRIFYM